MALAIAAATAALRGSVSAGVSVATVATVSIFAFCGSEPTACCASFLALALARAAATAALRGSVSAGVSVATVADVSTLVFCGTALSVC